MPLFAHGMILYLENPKDATVKLVQLIHGFGNVAGQNINAQKSLAFLYMKEEKKKEGLPFTPASKGVKYLGINLPRETGNLYTEKYKTLMNETEDDTNR